MDKNIIKEMISRQLDLIIEQFNNLNKHKGKIPQIDLDLMKRNVSILYEQLFELEKENSNTIFEKKKVVEVDKKIVDEPPMARIIEEETEEEVTFPVDLTPEPIIEEPEPPKYYEKKPKTIVEPPIVNEVIPIVFDEKPITITETIAPKEEPLIINEVPPVIIEEKPVIIEEPIVVKEEPIIVKEVPPIVIAEKPIINEEAVAPKEEPVIIKEVPPVIIEEKPIVKEEPVKVQEPVVNTPPKKEEKHVDLFGGTATTIADKYKKETKTVIDKLHNDTANRTIGTKHQHHAIKDLKSAIGINEKFLFINELFKGNMKEFNDVIIRLNDFSSLAEAESYLNQFKNKYQWADDLVSYLTLRDFVIRKYM